MRREEDEIMVDPPLPPLAGRASEKLEWRSLAYYNCAVCNRVGAGYIINIPPEEEEENLPSPVCGTCYYRMLNNKTDKKKVKKRQEI
jgi:hypothetical protein